MKDQSAKSATETLSETPPNVTRADVRAAFDETAYNLAKLAEARETWRDAFVTAVTETDANSPARHAVVKLLGAKLDVELALMALVTKRVEAKVRAGYTETHPRV